MRSLLFWTLGTAVAFALTAGTFLSLASLAGDSSGDSIPPRTQPRNDERPVLQLSFDEGQLEGLDEQKKKLSLGLTVRNSGDRTLSEVNVVLASFSADTSDPQKQFYRAPVKDLKAGESKKVTLDLKLPPAKQEKQWVLEARAATPGGISAIKTAVIER